MARLIDADALGIGKAKREAFEKPEYADGWNSAIDIIDNAPTVDAVHRETLAQVMWERDVAMKQLDEHGIPFGCKADVKAVVHGEWIDADERNVVSKSGYYQWICSCCGNKIFVYPWNNTHKYCYMCGAKMDGERTVSE